MGRLMHMLSDMDKIRYRLVVRLALSTPVAQSCLTRGRMCMECDGLHCMSWEKNQNSNTCSATTFLEKLWQELMNLFR